MGHVRSGTAQQQQRMQARDMRATDGTADVRRPCHGQCISMYIAYTIREGQRIARANRSAGIGSTGAPAPHALAQWRRMPPALGIPSAELGTKCPASAIFISLPPPLTLSPARAAPPTPTPLALQSHSSSMGASSVAVGPDVDENNRVAPAKVRHADQPDRRPALRRAQLAPKGRLVGCKVDRRRLAQHKGVAHGEGVASERVRRRRGQVAQLQCPAECRQPPASLGPARPGGPRGLGLVLDDIVNGLAGGAE
eukprot:scaffold158_cov126-Isochrysis_galbana.AAC.10